MHDVDVRRAIRHMLKAQYADDNSTRIVEEMGIWSGSVRIDIAVINGEMSGFELKSDRDTLARLPIQSELYGKVFDRLVLVAGARHAEKAAKLIPNWWGVIIATEYVDGINLSICREPGNNPAPDPYLVAQLLWKDEALRCLEVFGLAKGWRSKPVKAILERIVAELPFPELSAYVRETLKQRALWLGQTMCNERNMPINTDFNPSCPTSA